MKYGPHIQLVEKLFNIVARINRVSTEPREVFDNDAVTQPAFNILYHTPESRTLECCTGTSGVNISFI